MIGNHCFVGSRTDTPQTHFAFVIIDRVKSAGNYHCQQQSRANPAFGTKEWHKLALARYGINALKNAYESSDKVYVKDSNNGENVTYYLRWILTAELLLALRLTLCRNIKAD